MVLNDFVEKDPYEIPNIKEVFSETQGFGFSGVYAQKAQGAKMNFLPSFLKKLK